MVSQSARSGLPHAERLVMRPKRWDASLTTWGPWWLNAQRAYHGQLGLFWGVKVGPLAIYARWNFGPREEGG